MAHVPKSAKWYWAEVIEEIVVEGDTRNVVHRNLLLIRADSPAEAYKKSLSAGKQYQSSYKNPAGAIVRTRFRGLGGLDVIHDRLEHGAELLYQEDVGVSEDQIKKWIRAKGQLPLFRPDKEKSVPDYGSGEIVGEARKLMEFC